MDSTIDIRRRPEAGATQQTVSMSNIMETSNSGDPPDSVAKTPTVRKDPLRAWENTTLKTPDETTVRKDPLRAWENTTLKTPDEKVLTSTTKPVSIPSPSPPSMSMPPPNVSFGSPGLSAKRQTPEGLPYGPPMHEKPAPIEDPITDKAWPTRDPGSNNPNWRRPVGQQMMSPMAGSFIPMPTPSKPGLKNASPINERAHANYQERRPYRSPNHRGTYGFGSPFSKFVTLERLPPPTILTPEGRREVKGIAGCSSTPLYRLRTDTPRPGRVSDGSYFSASNHSSILSPRSPVSGARSKSPAF